MGPISATAWRHPVNRDFDRKTVIGFQTNHVTNIHIKILNTIIGCMIFALETTFTYGILLYMLYTDW